jgi:hypothetical protein
MGTEKLSPYQEKLWQHILAFEGFEPKVYPDHLNYDTVGVGFLVEKLPKNVREKIARDGEISLPDSKDFFFAQYQQKYEGVVKKYVGEKQFNSLPDQAKIALFSLAYNGEDYFFKKDGGVLTTAVKGLAASLQNLSPNGQQQALQDGTTVANIIKSIDSDDKRANRRNAEADMILSGVKEQLQQNKITQGVNALIGIVQTPIRPMVELVNTVALPFNLSNQMNLQRS